MNSAEARTPSPGEPAASVASAAETASIPIHPAQVLITEQEVLFGSAAAGALQAHPRPRWIRALRRALSSSDWHVDPQQRRYPPRSGYLENARMAREMYRL
jgi:hypothetical protein